MARQVLDLAGLPGLQCRDLQEGVDVFAEDGPAQERTLRAGGPAPRVYSWPVHAYPEDAESAREFRRALALDGEAFYVEDPWTSDRVDVEVGPAAGGQTVFTLPEDDDEDEYRDYPIDGSVTAKVAGVARGVASVDTDARQVTLASAATAGQSVTLSYRAYRLCQFGQGVTWTAEDADWYAGTLEIREIVREP